MKVVQARLEWVVKDRIDVTRMVTKVGLMRSIHLTSQMVGQWRMK